MASTTNHRNNNPNNPNKKMKNKIEILTNEYTDWLVENIDREYVENQDCSADAILYESLEGGQLTLTSDQQTWLGNFINRWEKAYL